MDTEPRFEDAWVYRRWFSIPDEWFVPLDEVLTLDQADDLPACDHLGSYRQYMQDISLWWPYAEQICGWLSPSVEAATVVDRYERLLYGVNLNGMEAPRVAAHVRRGDNVTNPPGTINCLPDSYYREALKLLGADNAVFFTDDYWYVREHFGDVAAHVFRGVVSPKENTEGYGVNPMDWLDLFLMERRPQHVISNSSYAWWGAVLSGDPSPVYPSYWWGVELTNGGADASLLIPDGWQMVSVDDPRPLQDERDSALSSDL